MLVSSLLKMVGTVLSIFALFVGYSGWDNWQKIILEGAER